MLYLSYVGLTPGLSNIFSRESHKVILKNLREAFSTCTEFLTQYPDYSLGFILATKEGTIEMRVNGPSIFKKGKDIDYTIFLPTIILDLTQYVDFVFDGIYFALKKYKVSEADIIAIREVCKEELSLK